MTLPTAPSPSAPRTWDVFCQVIDNFGDIGVCWRLAADLGARGHAVRLWTADASALAWMAPDGAPGVQVQPWPVHLPAGGPGDVVVEAFGCEIPPAFQAAMAADHHGNGRPPLWINLEYLSAEAYVERSHRLSSMLFSGPGAGCTRWFFYPGFTPGTGGLLREPALPARQAAFDRDAWRARQGVAPGVCALSLFCYEPPALPELLTQLSERPATHLLVTPGRATAAVQAWQKNSHDTPQRPSEKHQPLSISYLPSRTQAAFDELLWACDVNFVRGEDSLVRALWAGQPLVWHIYPQHDNAHHAKLEAFLDWLQAPASLRRFHARWNGLESSGPLPPLDTATLKEWRHCVRAARERLLGQDDLLTQLLGFVAEKS